MISRADSAILLANILRPHTTIKVKRELQTLLGSKSRIIFMSMFSDIKLNIGHQAMSKHVSKTEKEVTEDAKHFQLGHWCFCGPRKARVWCWTSSGTPAREWDRTTRKMTQKSEEASHPIFSCADPFLKRDLKSNWGKETFHFQRTTQTQIIIFAQFWHAINMYLRRSVCLV